MVEYIVFLTINVGLYSIFALGLNLQWGICGLINFGLVAFMILGSYTTVLLSLKGVPIIIAVAIGALLAALLGLLIGLSTLRLREDYLSIVTIGGAETLRLIVQNEQGLTKGTFGIQSFPLPFSQWEPNLFLKLMLIAILTILAVFCIAKIVKSVQKNLRNKLSSSRRRLYLAVMGVLGVILTLLIYINGVLAVSDYSYKVGLMILELSVLALIYLGLEFLINSPWGRVLKAIREDEEVAKALGKNVFIYKLQAFLIGGAIAGIAGSFFAWQLTAIYPSNFDSLVTFNAWIIVVLGGAGSNVGTILGSVIFWLYESATRFLPTIGFLSESQVGALRVMLIGLILIVLMMSRPQGLLGKGEELTLDR
jgi:neutral amino acid transport system permease protein